MWKLSENYHVLTWTKPSFSFPQTVWNIISIVSIANFSVNTLAYTMIKAQCFVFKYQSKIKNL